MDLINPTMLCSWRSSCLYLTVYLVDFLVEGFSSCLYQICQEEYVLLNYINFGEGSGRFVVIQLRF